MQALDLYRAIMNAAAIAPTAEQAQCTAYAIEKAHAKTHAVNAAAWCHWGGLASGSAAEYIYNTAHAEALGELIETASRDLARKHATFTHAAGRVKMVNTRERLQGFAADMLKGAAWALWGGGEKPAELIKPRKARAVTPWRAGLIKVAGEALQDGQAADFFAIAMEQLGGRAYMHNVGKPFIAYAPDYAEGLPEGFAVVRKCSGEWITTHMETGFSAGQSSRVKAQALQSGREAIANAGPEKFASALARARGMEAHHAGAIDAWREGYGLAPMAQDVPEVVAQAQDVPEVVTQAQDVPEVVTQAQDVPEVVTQAQDVPEVVAQAAGMVPRAWIATAAADLERITWTWTYDAARRMNIEAGRLGVPGALRYIREALQRIATNGAGLEKTEAINALQSLAQAQAQDVATLKAAGPEAAPVAQLQAEELQAAATVATLVAIGRASVTSAQQIEAQAPEVVAMAGEVVAMAADGERGRIQRTGDTFADYWANSASASIERDITAGRARVVHIGARPGAADVVGQADTPPAAGPGAAGPDTPTPPAAPDYSAPVETQAPAPDYSAPVETQAQAADFLRDIPATLARGAFNGTSFSPERRGDSARDCYAGSMAEDYSHFLQHATKGGTLDKLEAEFSRYRARLAGLYRAYLASQSRCVSSMIAGPSNFPAARMNKRADITHRRLGEYFATRETARRAVVRNLRPDLRPIMAGDADAVERLAVELAAAERAHETMKHANSAIRQHAKAGMPHQVAALMELGYSEEKATRLIAPPPNLACYGQGFASFTLTNSSANIRRMRQRLEHLERCKAAAVTEATGADGVRLEDDPPANRVRLFFPGKPAAAVRDALKSAGFRWAPSLGAWQGYRNHWTMQKARELAGITAADLKPADDTPDAYSEAGAADTPTPPAAPDYSAPVETQAQADDCTQVVETLPASRKLRGRAWPWSATLQTSAGGSFCVEFIGADGAAEKREYPSRRDRAAGLRALIKHAENDAAGYDDDAEETEPQAPAPVTFKQITPDPENAPDLAAWFAVATASETAAEYHQDALDHKNGQRLHQTRQALAALGWSDSGNPKGWPLIMQCESLRAQWWHVGAGRNVARITWQTTDGATVADDWTMTPQQLAEDLHASACVLISVDDFASAAQGMTPEQCERVALKLEAINYHGDALQWRCLGAGALDLAERAAAINREQLRTGELSCALEHRRQAVSAELKARTTTPPTDPGPGAGAPDCTEVVETQAQADDCTKAVETQAPDYFTQADVGRKTTIPGWPDNTIEGLFDALSRWALDPSCLILDESPPIVPAAWGDPLKGAAWRCRQQGRHDLGYHRTEYILTAPIYPDHPFCVHYNGNFAGYSFGFQVATDDPDLIARLDAAIAENIARPDTQEALQHARERKWGKTSRNTTGKAT
jgi:hypothetical protein